MMNYDYYERKINDVITKCPIEAGVEILIYNLLDSVMDFSKVALVDINRLWKDRDTRLTTDSGIPDIAVLSTDFEYRNEDNGDSYGFIEVKATNQALDMTEQVKGQMKKRSHYIYTNGLVWIYFKNEVKQWEKVLAFYENQECKEIHIPQKISIDSNEFDDLVKKLEQIEWCPIL